MEGAEKGDKESPPLQIDPKCFQDALRTFFQPIKADDPRLDFYTMYKREATEYDADYVKKYDDDLNTTLIFAGLFSAVSSAFVIDVHSNLQPDPNVQSAALLREILLTLNLSAITGETPTIQSLQQNPSSEIVIVTCLMYASLMMSLLAAFVAMLGKQWLNRYLRNSGGSVIERCGDRQRKCDGLEKWPLHTFVEGLPVMLQISLLLLACGLCRYMWSINAFVAGTLIILTGLGASFYIAIVIAGMSSYACPFQTPVSTNLRNPWKKVRHGIVSSIVRFKRVFSRTHRMWNQRVRSLLRHQSLPTAIPLENVQVDRSELWLKLRDLDVIRRSNASDAQCVSWILRNITDPEALDAAIRLAGGIRWFDDGADANPPYDLIVSTFEGCFDSTRRLYPGSRERAYYSGRAIMWIHTLAMCKSEDFARAFPLLGWNYTTPVPDPDLRHLLQANFVTRSTNAYIAQLLEVNPNQTSSHSQWVSDLLLHHSWANRTHPNFELILDFVSGTPDIKTNIPLNVRLNRLLMWCTFLGSPVEEEALKAQDKSDRIEPILDRLSKAVLSAINGTPGRRRFIRHMLCDLVRLEAHPERLTEIAYEWCSMIYENRQGLRSWESLLLVCLEIGFRHIDFRRLYIEATLIHTEHHRGLVDAVFKSPEGEVIADLLHAWTSQSSFHKPAHALLDLCAGHLVGLRNLFPFSPRLRWLVIRSIEAIDYERFKGGGVEKFIELLDHLRVTGKDIVGKENWAKLLLETLKSSEGAQRLSYWYWELLVGLAISESPWLRLVPARSLEIITSLTEAKEWSKLECWIGIVWMVLTRKENAMVEGDLGHSMLLLSRQRPLAIPKLEQWMERWGKENDEEIPESFQRICKQVLEAARRDAPPISSVGKGAEGSVSALPPVPSKPSGGNEFWELLPF